MTLRTVGNWERGETVPQNRMARIQDVLASHLDNRTEQSDPLASLSDMALLSELARRLDRARGQGEVGEPAPIGTQVRATHLTDGGTDVKAGSPTRSRARSRKT